MMNIPSKETREDTLKRRLRQELACATRKGRPKRILDDIKRKIWEIQKNHFGHERPSYK